MASKTRLNYGTDGAAHLAAPIGFSQRLETDKPIELAWSTEDRRALDLEFQLQIVDLGGLPGAQLHLLRWQIWYHAHGGQNFDYPPVAAFGGTNRARRPEWSFPARGIRERLSARELRISLVVTQEMGVTGSPLIEASIQPVGSAGAAVPVFPRQGYSDGARGGTFPMGAMEWRLFGIDPAELVDYRDFDGVIVSSAPAASFADWTPIPAIAASWEPQVTSGEALYR